MKKLLAFVVATFAAAFVFGGVYEVSSPNGALSAKISDGENLKFSVLCGGNVLLENCEIGMSTSCGELGKNARVQSVKKSSKNEIQDAKFYIKSKVKNHYNELVLKFKNYSVVFRAYDDSICYRFVTDFGKCEMIVNSEKLILPFAKDAPAIAHHVGGWRTPFEEYYTFDKIENLDKRHSYTMPFFADAGDFKIALMESDLVSYPALRVKYSKELGAMYALFAPYPKKFEEKDRHENVVEAENYIAKTVGSRAFTWRILQVAKTSYELAESDAVYRLARDSKIKDTSWITTGSCQWDWWHNWTLEGVDFNLGINDDSISYYIDFAAKYKMAYMLVDEGWIKGDAMHNDDLILSGDYRIDVKKLAERANSQGVKLALWAQLRTVKKNPEKICAYMSGLGVSALKLDFIDRDDQLAVEIFENVAEIAAKYKIAVDYHGCPTPSGLNKTYPNIIGYEAVRGNENNKGGKVSTAHQVNVAMSRNIVGPMDFTAGGMNNVLERNWAPSSEFPRVLGSRAHQMAMYVCYFVPYEMLCDSPSLYARYPDVTSFIAQVPRVWDETKAISGDFNDHFYISRRKGDVWYFAAMTSKEGREFTIDLSKLSLKKGAKYEVEIFRDSQNTHRLARDYKREVKEVCSTDVIKVRAVRDGGFVAKISEKK